MNLIDEILKPPFRERRRVEAALAKAEPKDALVLALLINQGDVRGDWRRALVRRRLAALGTNATCARAAARELGVSGR